MTLLPALLPLALACAAPSPVAAQTTERVEFQSADYSSHRQLFKRIEPARRPIITGYLRLPDDSARRRPAIVLVPSSTGYDEQNEGRYAGMLLKNGFAVFRFESASSRGLSFPVSKKLGDAGSLVYSTADAFAALEWLAKDPRIDPDRIAIAGFSGGGEAALMTAFDRVRATKASGNLRFFAHIAFYPIINTIVVPDAEAYTGAPILLLQADQDDIASPSKMSDYLAFARRAGNPAPIETIVYAGAYHNWGKSPAGSADTQTLNRFWSRKDCPMELLDRHGRTLLIGGEKRPFDEVLWKKCVKQLGHYTLKYDAAVVSRSTDDAVAFLRKHLPK